jgi:hypothetical protein
LTLHYIIGVQTQYPDGNPYEDHPEDRARETFNLMPGRVIDDPVNLTDSKQEDLPEEKLQQALLRHDVRFISSKKSEPQSSALAKNPGGSTDSGHRHQTRS